MANVIPTAAEFKVICAQYATEEAANRANAVAMVLSNVHGRLIANSQTNTARKAKEFGTDLKEGEHQYARDCLASLVDMAKAYGYYLYTNIGHNGRTLPTKFVFATESYLPTGMSRAYPVAGFEVPGSAA